MGSKKRGKKRLKILAVSDFHGRFPKILTEDKDFDIIIAPGDYCGSSKIRKIMFANWEDRREWYSIVGKREARKLVLESIASGKEIVKRLVGFGKPVFGIPGNLDYTGAEDHSWSVYHKNHYKEFTADKLYKDIDLKRRLFEGFQLIGYGECSYPEKYSDPEMYFYFLERIGRIFKKRKPRVPVIFVPHNVPYGVLDTVGMKASPMYGEHMGSDVALALIKKFKPLLCIAGHMHETQGRRKIGKTTVVNCGFGYKGQYAIIEIDDKKKVKVKLRGQGGKS